MRICPVCAELLPDDGHFCPFDGAELVQATDPFLGRTIAGRFRLIKRLGTGGMSTVYLARHVMIDRLNAIKILRPDLSLSPSHRERFLREARAVNRINHRNIVEITDYGEVDAALYLVMEYVAGESLLAHIAQGPMPWDRAARIALQITSALARAHQAGVVHRDLKPENVMLVQLADFPDLVKLTDFGIAKILDAPAITFNEQTFGTPGYIAPEYLDGVAPDGRADLYALGVVLYEMIAGKLPYTYRGSSDLLMKPITSAPIPLATRVPDVPPAIDALALRMLARYRDDRPGDAFEVQEALLDALRSYAPGVPLVPGAYVGEPRAHAPTLPDSVIDLDVDGAESAMSAMSGRPTANVGRVQTSEMASRWNAALEALDASIARATRKGGARAKGAARAQGLAEHARDLVVAVERGQAKVAEHQARTDRVEARGREFRAPLGRAIDESVRQRSRERARIASMRARVPSAPPPLPRSERSADAKLWEDSALAAEEARSVDVEAELSSRIGDLEARLDAENEAFDVELVEARAVLEGAISAVRQLTHELVRTLDEAAAVCSRA